MATRTLTAVLHREGDVYVAQCPEVGTLSQGETSKRPSPICAKRPSCTWNRCRSHPRTVRWLPPSR